MTDSSQSPPVAGDLLTSFEMDVEAGKVREFARATSAQHEELWTGPDGFAPPTFLTTMAFWRSPDAPLPSAALGWSMRRLLHGGSEYVFPKGPIRIGAHLRVEVRLESLTEKVGSRGGHMTLATTATSFIDESDEVVAIIRSTLIKKGDDA
jgi:hypothetical protein